MRPSIVPINRFKLSIRISIEMADILPVRHRTQTGGMSALLSSLSELCTLHSFPSFTPDVGGKRVQSSERGERRAQRHKGTKAQRHVES